MFERTIVNKSLLLYAAGSFLLLSSADIHA